MGFGWRDIFQYLFCPGSEIFSQHKDDASTAHYGQCVRLSQQGSCRRSSSCLLFSYLSWRFYHRIWIVSPSHRSIGEREEELSFYLCFRQGVLSLGSRSFCPCFQVSASVGALMASANAMRRLNMESLDAISTPSLCQLI